VSVIISYFQPSDGQDGRRTDSLELPQLPADHAGFPAGSASRRRRATGILAFDAPCWSASAWSMAAGLVIHALNCWTTRRRLWARRR